MATEKVEIRTGVKVEQDEVAELDPAQMGVLITGTPPASDVEGQDIIWGYTRCPWCGLVGRSLIDTERYRWYTCGACGRPFRA